MRANVRIRGKRPISLARLSAFFLASNVEKEERRTKIHVTISFATCQSMDLSDSSGSLSWYELSDIQNMLRKYALVQLLRMFQKHKNRRGDCFLWGDEVGYKIRGKSMRNLPLYTSTPSELAQTFRACSAHRPDHSGTKLS